MKQARAVLGLILVIEAGIIAGTGMVPRGTDPYPTGARRLLQISARHENAMLAIEGTTITEPIIQATEQEGNAYFLSHDRSGAASYRGTIFADYRCVQPSRHLLLYGHSFGYGTGMFTELKHAWQKDRFETIGQATLSVGDKTIIYRPIAALNVNADYTEIQRFVFVDNTELRPWLTELVASADAKAEKSADEIARAQHALTLVTCSDLLPGKPGRTVVIFTSASPERIPPLPGRS